jgi:hypothetical protein
MLTRDGEKQAQYADHQRQGGRIDHSDRWWQLQEGILEEPLQLKAEQYLDPEHLHS